MLTGPKHGDSLYFQVVDNDGVWSSWCCFKSIWHKHSSRHRCAVSDWYDSPYVAYLYQGLYIRVKYTSTGVDSVNLRAVVRLHKPVT